MKRFLSLVLTLVMVMSLVTVSAGAKDFTDDDTITYDEAVAVVSEIGVVDGYTDGSFKPSNTLTRQAAAKIICNLKLGPTTAAELHADTAPYKDVPANNEFAGYIAYCQKEGIISGYGDGTFRPGAPLTGYAFMKMLLGALGYDATLEGYVHDNWSINVAKQAIHIGLNKGLEGEFNGIKPVNREEACLYAFNTLQADLVEYGQRLTTNINGTEVTLSSGGAQSREWNSQQTRINNIINDNVIQFAEEYFNKLVKTPDSDKFERPAHTWVYDKKVQIGTWLDQDKLVETYTTGVTGRDLYDLLGSAIIRDYDLEVYVDGHVANNSTTQYNQYVNADKNGKFLGTYEEFTMADLKRSNTDDLGATGDGVLTEVFKDDDNETIIVTSIHTWLAQATSAYNESKESASVKVHMKLVAGTKAGSLDLVSTTKIVALDDVPEVAEVAADDFYLVRMSDKDTTLLEVVDMEEPEILEESAITKFSLGTKYSKGEAGLKYPTKLTTGGNEYADSDRACYDVDVLDQYDQDLLTTNTYNVYLDKYGYFIGLDLFEGTKQYVFVTGYDMKNSNLSVKTAEASGIFLDGTMETMTVNVKDTNKNIEEMVDKKDNANAELYYQQWGVHASDGVYLLNRWYTYTKTEAGVYTLKPCVNKDGEAMMLATRSPNQDDDDGPESLKLNCAKLRLDGVDATDGLLIGEEMQYATTGLESHRAYGEDASVFITVDVDQVSAKAGGTETVPLNITKAITDVNGVYSGVQDVDLFSAYDNRVVGQYWYEPSGKAVARKNDTLGGNENNDGFWVGHDGKDNTALTSEGEEWKSGDDVTQYSYIGENAYAVFDRNNFIIGAIILGDAVGSNATKAYILDPVKYERYENGTYYWQFEAVINGEKVTQEAESKFRDTIDTMRNNQFEIVELRYKGADQEVVTNVKELKRTDDQTDLDKAQDNIYGYPYKEITSDGHKVLDKETVYDVVLTGKKTGEGQMGKPAVGATKAYTDFTYVTRPRANDEEHNWYTTGGAFVEERFTTTNGDVDGNGNLIYGGVLRLQGRTLYVLDDQRDYGIDFVTGAKAVVRQREGTVDNNDWETREYSSVQEAIDSLGDPDPTTGEKEFRGIITAALDSRGVAEWVVFYSDTLAETKNNTSVTSTMRVKINVRFGATGEAIFWDWYDAPKPANSDVVVIPTPEQIKGPDAVPDGWTVVETQGIPTVWDKKAEGKEVTFTYIEDGTGGTTPKPSADSQGVRVLYLTDYTDTDTEVGRESVTVGLDVAGYGTLTEDLLKLPNGFVLDPDAVTGTDTDLGEEIEKQAVGTNVTMKVQVVERTDVTKVEILPAAKARAAGITLDVPVGTSAANDVKTAAVAAKLRVQVTYGTEADKNLATRILAANATGLAWAIDNGVVTVTYTSTGDGAEAVDSTNSADAVEYADLAKAKVTFAAAGNQLDTTNWEVKTVPTGHIYAGDTVTVTVAQKSTKEADFTADDIAGKAVTATATGSSCTIAAEPAAAARVTKNGATADPDGDPVVEAAAAEIEITFKVATILKDALEVELTIAS